MIRARHELLHGFLPRTSRSRGVGAQLVGVLTCLAQLLSAFFDTTPTELECRVKVQGLLSASSTSSDCARIRSGLSGFLCLRKRRIIHKSCRVFGSSSGTIPFRVTSAVQSHIMDLLPIFWTCVGGLLLLLFFISHFKPKKKSYKSTTKLKQAEEKASSSSVKVENPEIKSRKRQNDLNMDQLHLVSDQDQGLQELGQPPKATGSDAESVNWINSCLSRLFASKSRATELVSLWRDSLNDFNKANEVSFDRI